jgi:hypothetical protein
MGRHEEVSAVLYVTVEYRCSQAIHLLRRSPRHVQRRSILHPKAEHTVLVDRFDLHYPRRRRGLQLRVKKNGRRLQRRILRSSRQSRNKPTRRFPRPPSNPLLRNLPTQRRKALLRLQNNRQLQQRRHRRIAQQARLGSPGTRTGTADDIFYGEPDVL